MEKIQNIKSEINIEKSIESIYILKDIFSFLSENQKLYLIIYNKHLQKKFGININDYKGKIGRYKKGERNGKGKEYNISTNILLFEGEYLNGRRNGKGKEYYSNGKLKFEGEYLSGKRWNGNGYNKDGKIDFEIKKGKGKGKEYYDDDRLLFEGEYLNGERNGKGKEYYDDDRLLFEGE